MHQASEQHEAFAQGPVGDMMWKAYLPVAPPKARNLFALWAEITKSPKWNPWCGYTKYSTAPDSQPQPQPAVATGLWQRQGWGFYPIGIGLKIFHILIPKVSKSECFGSVLFGQCYFELTRILHPSIQNGPKLRLNDSGGSGDFQPIIEFLMG